ncbi:MAG: hemolysin family protein [Candidatus Melainabacteria bacterium]|nr:hemolysin family protein [Candidatus Melainabacteria bacterium]
MDILIPTAIIFVLVFFNAFFVAAEFAIVAVSRPFMESEAARGIKGAQQIIGILQDPVKQDFYIATAQVGITVASLGLGMYGEHILAEWILGGLSTAGITDLLIAHGVASTCAVSILTYLHVVLGEMVPKSLALQFTEKTVLWIVAPMLLWTRILYPVVLILNKVSTGLLTLIGISRRESTLCLHTTDELELIIDESKEGGLIGGETGDVIRHLFDFSDRNAEEVMVPRIHMSAIEVSNSPEQILETISLSHHTYYPVFENDKDHIVGVVHIKDLLPFLSGQTAAFPALRQVPFVPATAPLQIVLDSMSKVNSQVSVVLDEFGGTAGLITTKDIFEEVLGGFGQWEKFSAISKEVALRVPGTARLDEIGEKLNIILEHAEVNTVGGLVLTLLNRPPTSGDAVSFGIVRIQVTQVVGRGIQECVIRLQS